MSDDFEMFYREAKVMGDLMMRISLLVQRGVLCQSCGCELHGEMTGSPRACTDCAPSPVDEDLSRSRNQTASATRAAPKRSASSA